MTERLTCTLCRCRVHVASDGTETVRQGGKPVPHRHRKAYEVIPGSHGVPDREGDDRDREWWWVAHGPSL